MSGWPERSPHVHGVPMQVAMPEHYLLAGEPGEPRAICTIICAVCILDPAVTEPVQLVDRPRVECEQWAADHSAAVHPDTPPLTDEQYLRATQLVGAL